MRIAIIGAGHVGKRLGAVLKAKGHGVVFGVRDPQPSAGVVTKSVGGAIAGADVVILATPWTIAEALVCEHAPALTGKIVIDITNPLSPSANRLALGFVTSGVELLQSQAQRATFFKALNTASFNAVASPGYPQGAAAGFVAGPRGSKKDIVLSLVAELGFEPVDAGDLRAARLLEPLGMLSLQLEDSWGKDRDFAFVMGARDLKQIPSTPSPAGLRVADHSSKVQ
jgi:predicted dinucleotide-binding enzyme